MDVKTARRKLNANLEKMGVMPGSKLLLAVSGGRDSMCLLHLFSGLPYHFSVAHVNFRLRGEESDKDSELVSSYCVKHAIEFLYLESDTKLYSEENKISIQEAAREIRYSWFKELADSMRFDFIITAHHLHDSIETFFINLLRGTGINGLSGIPEKRDNIIRPLLDFRNDEIKAVVEAEKIPYREDSTNLSDKYLRNQVRQKLIPVIEEISPGFSDRMEANMELLSREADVLQGVLALRASEFVSHSGDRVTVNLKGLTAFADPAVLLYFIAAPFGFTPVDCRAILRSTDHAGATFFSKSHQLLIDRDVLIIEKIKQAEEFSVAVIPGKHVFTPYGQFTIDESQPPYKFGTDPNTELIDADKIVEPLTLRNWQQGDKFKPIGMTGSQKVKDYLINAKVNLFDKRDVLVFTSGKEIVWLLGYRLSDKYKVSDNTQKVYRLSWKPGSE